MEEDSDRECEHFVLKSVRDTERVGERSQRGRDICISGRGKENDENNLSSALGCFQPTVLWINIVTCASTH